MKRILLICLAVVALVVLGLALTVLLRHGDWLDDVGDITAYRSSLEEAAGPPPPLVTNVRGREIESLAGTWPAIIDPSPSMLARLFGLLPRNARPAGPSDLVEFSFEGGLELSVPGDWNTQDPRLFFYQGGVWYLRKFAHEPLEKRRAFLWFGAANHRTEAFLNGVKVGEHTGGFTAFNFEITEALVPGENTLVVWVDNDLVEGDIPPRQTDWLDYGGITREVFVVDLPETFIRSYEVQLAPGLRDRIRCRVELDGPDAKEQRVTLSIPGLEIAVDAVTDRDGRAEFRVPAYPELWSPESPRLYDVTLRSESDEVGEPIGFRSLGVRGREVLLNGDPIYLRGISIHEEAPGGTRAFSPEHAETLLGWAKDLGANYVRLAHYQHNEHMLRAADRLGLVVWAEIPLWGENDYGEPLLAKARARYSEMVARDRNRASIAFWSIGNETPITDERNEFMRKLAEHVRALDDTRLVSGAILFNPDDIKDLITSYLMPASVGIERETWPIVLSDPLSEVLDVAAVNQYIGWYYSSPASWMLPIDAHEARRLMVENLPRVRIDPGVEKPLLVSEFGAGAVVGRRADPDALVVFSEDYQALVYRKQLEMIAANDSISGLSPWILKDFRSAMRLYQGVQDYWNLKGIVADDGSRKQAFGVLQREYQRLAGR